MSSTPSRMPTALRRVMTVKSPSPKSTAPTIKKCCRESGPMSVLLPIALHRAAREDDGADHRAEQHDRSELEGEHVLAEERVPEVRGRGNLRAILRGPRRRRRDLAEQREE